MSTSNEGLSDAGQSNFNHDAFEFVVNKEASLIDAVIGHHTAAIRELIAGGADPWERSDLGLNAFDYALIVRNFSAIDEFLKQSTA